MVTFLFPQAIDWAKRLVPAEHLTRREHIATWQYRYAIRMHLALLRHTSHCAPREIEALQQKRLQRVLTAALRSPWWHTQLTIAGIKPYGLSLDELKKIPVQSKRVLAELPVDNLLTTRDRSFLLWRTTTGTSGIPIRWAQDVRTHFLEYAAYYLRSLEYFSFPIERNLGRKFFLMFNYPQVECYYLSFFAQEVNIAYDRFIAGKKRIAARDERSAAYEAIQNCHPGVLYGAPSALWFLAQAMEDDGVEVTPDLVVVSGEMISEDIRSYLEQIFHCPIRSFYGTRELGTIAFHCSTGGNIFHLNSEEIILEVLDNDGRESPTGAFGDLVMTSLGNTVMPLLRYRVGDVGRLVKQSCACHTTLPRFELIGRESEFLLLPDGRRSTIWNLYTAIFSGKRFLKIAQYQIEQTAPDAIILKIVQRTPWTTGEREELLGAIRDEIGQWLRARVEFVEEIQPDGHKFRTFIPLRPSSH